MSTNASTVGNPARCQRGRAFARKLAEALARTSGMDLRSLALFRVGLGLVVFIDLFQRLRHFKAFYHFEGIVPPGSASIGFLPVLDGFDAHALSLPVLWAGLIAAALLILGRKARTMAALCWIVLAFLNSRNWMVLHLADRLVLLMLMWAVLLPIGRHWALDARDRARREQRIHFGVATVGLHLQVAVVYFTGALLKSRQPTWRDGSHLGNTIERIEYLSPVGMVLKDLTFLHTPTTWIVLYLQLFGALLLLTPWRFTHLRGVILGSLALLQLGMGTALNVGLFPWISIVGLIALVPPGVWGQAHSTKLRVTSAKSVPHRLGAYAQGSIGLLFITVMTLETLNDHLHLRSASGFVGHLPGGSNFMQRWTMFTAPASHGGWFIVPAITSQGDTINLLRDGEPPSRNPPSDPWKDFRSHRWRILIANSLRATQIPENRERFLRYLMEDWNDKAEPRAKVKSLELVEMRFPLQPTADPANAVPTTLASFPE